MQRAKVAWLHEELPKLVHAGILTEETADRMRQHYGPVTPGMSLSRVAVVLCGILGAALVGAGVILLLAHNWEDLSRPIRTVLAFAPLLAGQVIAGWVLLRRRDSIAWSEGSAVFLTAAIGACIALIAQTYHISGNLASFLFTWLWLGIPLVYLLRSTSVAILFLVGATAWAGAEQAQGGHALWYWPLLAAVLPYLWQVHREQHDGPRALLLGWVFCLNSCVALGIVLEKTVPGLWIPIYSALFAVCYAIGRKGYRDTPFQPYTLVACAGTAVLSLLFTYDFAWDEIGWRHYRHGGQFWAWAAGQDYVLTVVLLSVAVIFLVWRLRQRDWAVLPWGIFPLLALASYLLTCFGWGETTAMAVFNGYLLALGLFGIAAGVHAGSLAMTNGGMATLSALFIARFFDSELSFTFRGIGFILIGVGFLAANAIFVRHTRKQKGAAS